MEDLAFFSFHTPFFSWIALRNDDTPRALFIFKRRFNTSLHLVLLSNDTSIKKYRTIAQKRNVSKEDTELYTGSILMNQIDIIH